MKFKNLLIEELKEDLGHQLRVNDIILDELRVLTNEYRRVCALVGSPS